jgi:Tol biopolymer transport system component
VGTFEYMSPEQVRAEELDARTDLFSFGVVLYEMATGQPAFSGRTSALIFDAILHKAPTSPVRLNPEVPLKLEEIINKALEKDRDLRYHSAGDLRADLKRLKRDTESGRAGAVAAVSPSATAIRTSPLQGRWAIALTAVTLVAVIGAAIGYHFFRLASKAPAPPMNVVPFTAFPGHQDYARFSPDGKQIAFAWDGEKEDNWDIYVKLIGTERPLRLTTDPGQDSRPAWSPDSRYIAFLHQTENKEVLHVVPALGGPERKLETPGVGGALRQSESYDWSPDGKYLLYADRRPNQAPPTLFLLAVDNPDDIRPLTTSAGQTADYAPRFSPNGQTVAFVRCGTYNADDIFLVRIAGGEPKRLTFDNASLHGLDWTPDGTYIIFSSERLGGSGRLWKVPASGGQPEPLSVGQEGALRPALSRDGRFLAYTQMSYNENIWRYEVPRAKGRSAPPTKLIASTYSSHDPQFSPDGKRVVFTSDRSGSWQVWLCDSDGSNPRQLTFSDRWVGSPHWSPDGREIAFESIPEDHFSVCVVSAEGGRPRRLRPGVSNDSLPKWSVDGKWIYFVSDRTGVFQVWKMPVEGGQAVQVTKKGGFAAFESVDGKALYYAKGPEVPGLWKVPVEGGEETPVIEQLAAGHWGSWGLTAEGIYFYNAGTKAIEFYSFATQKVTQIAKPEKPPASGERQGLAVSPDGRSILWSQVDQSTSNIILVENFRW